MPWRYAAESRLDVVHLRRGQAGGDVIDEARVTEARFGHSRGKVCDAQRVVDDVQMPCRQVMASCQRRAEFVDEPFKMRWHRETGALSPTKRRNRALSRRPGEAAAGEHVQVDVEDRLARLGVGVEHRAIAALGVTV